MRGGFYPCPNFLALFQEVHFWSIKRVYFFQIANVLIFVCLVSLYISLSSPYRTFLETFSFCESFKSSDSRRKGGPSCPKWVIGALDDSGTAWKKKLICYWCLPLDSSFSSIFFLLKSLFLVKIRIRFGCIGRAWGGMIHGSARGQRLARMDLIWRMDLVGHQLMNPLTIVNQLLSSAQTRWMASIKPPALTLTNR